MKLVQNILVCLFLLIPPFCVYQASVNQAQIFVESHWAQQLSSGDQFAIYTAFKDTFEQKQSPGVSAGWMPAGYLALIGFYHKISGIWTHPSIEASFIFSGVFYTVLLAFFSVLLMYRVSRRQAPLTNSVLLAFGSSAIWFAMFRLSGVLRFSFIPWSHYASAFVGVCLVASTFECFYSQRKYWYSICAFFAFLFLNTRRHEALALLILLACAALLLLIHRFLYKNLNFTFKSIFLLFNAAALGTGLAVFFIWYFSNGTSLNGHYAQYRTHNSSIDELLKIYPSLAYTRLMQTFFDPDFYTSSISYSAHSIYNKVFGMDDFGMPLIFQMPILLFLVPVSVASLAATLFRKNFWKKEISPAILMLLISFSFFLVLTGACLSSAVWGSAHLAHGLIREFILSTQLLTIGTGPSLSLFLASQFNQKHLSWLIPSVGILFFSFILGQLILPQSELYMFPSFHLSSDNKMIHQCNNGKCRVKLEFFTKDGQIFTPGTDSNFVSFHCAEGFENMPFSKGDAGQATSGQNFEFNIIKCPSKVEVNIYPLFMGMAGSGLSVFKFSACPDILLAPNCQP